MSTETVKETVKSEPTEDQVLQSEIDADDKLEVNGGAASVIAALNGLVKTFGTQVRKYLDTDTALVEAIAIAMVSELRCMFVFNGRPDLGGQSVAYQTANRMAIARLVGPRGTKDEMQTMRNRLQKRVVRFTENRGHLLTQGVVEYVIQRDKVDLNDTQRGTLRVLRFKTIGECKDKKVLAVVASVNELFGAQLARRKSTDPRSQYEKSFVPSNEKGKSRKAKDAANDAATQNLATVQALPTATASGNVKDTDTLSALLHSLYVIRGKIAAKRPAPRDAETIGGLLLDISFMAYGVKCDMFGETLTGEDLDGYAAAIDNADADFGEEIEDDGDDA